MSFRNFSHSASVSFRLDADFAVRLEDFAGAFLVCRLVDEDATGLRDEV